MTTKREPDGLALVRPRPIPQHRARRLWSKLVDWRRPVELVEVDRERGRESEPIDRDVQQLAHGRMLSRAALSCGAV